MGKLAMASLKMAKQPPAPVPLVLISDPGQDLDDEMSYIMLRYLVKKGLVELRGIICTLAPAFDRARLCRGTLDLLGLHDCPVGIGTDGGDQEGLHTAKCFAESASSYMPAAASESCSTLTPGRGLLLGLGLGLGLGLLTLPLPLPLPLTLTSRAVLCCPPPGGAA